MTKWNIIDQHDERYRWRHRTTPGYCSYAAIEVKGDNGRFRHYTETVPRPLGFTAAVEADVEAELAEAV